MRRYHDVPVPSYVATTLLLVTLAACGSGGGPTPPTGSPSSIAISAGNEQQAAAGTAVLVAPAVVVKDAEGEPMAGVAVQFTVAAGGGTVVGGSATSDGNGIARVTTWTLGVSGEQRLTAKAGTLAAVTFNATITAGTEGITSNFGPAGGTMAVTTPGHPLEGLAVAVPAGSFAAPGVMSMRALTNASAPALPAGYRVVGPIIEVTSAQHRASHLMRIEVPVTRAANEDIVLVLHDPVRHVTEALLTVDRGASSVTAMAAHLRADLLLGPASAATLQAAFMGRAGESGWLMAVAFPVPQPEVTLPFDRWPVLDYGSVKLPNGFGPGIPALLALQAARKVQGLSGRFKSLGTPGFYAEAAPMAAAILAHDKLAPKIKSVLGEALTAISHLTKTTRDEMLHRNHVASIVLTGQSIVSGLLRTLNANDVIFVNSVAGTETSIGLAHPGLAGIVAIARNAVSGYESTSMPITPDQQAVLVQSAVPLTSFLVPFEEITDHLNDLLQTLDLPAKSAERKARNSLMATVAGIIQPILEIQHVPGDEWQEPGTGPIAIRNQHTLIRSTNGNPAELAVHDEAGEVVVMAVAAPIEAEEMVMALPVGQATTYVVSGVQTTGSGVRQTAPSEEQLVRAPFQLVPDNFALVFGASEVTFDAAVPSPPQGGYRIRWEWGDGHTTEVANAIRGVHDYEQVQEREVIATLLPASGSTRLAVDTATVSSAQPFWKITTFDDADGFYGGEPEPGETDDVFYRARTPGVGMIALVAVPGGRELRIYAKGSGSWEPADCCPPTFTPADDWLLIGEDPRVFHGDLGSFWSSWRDTGLIFNGTISNGSFSGHSIGPKHTFAVEDGGSQVGTEHGLEFNLNMNGTSISGIMTLTIWGIDDETGEVDSDSEQQFRFILSGVRLH